MFVTEDDFNFKLSMFYNKFQHYPAAKIFIDEKLILNKKKLLRFLQNIFSPPTILVVNVQNRYINFFKEFGSMK